MINTLGCAGSVIFLLIFDNSTTALWIGIIFYGLFMSSTFPAAMNWTETYVKLTGKPEMLSERTLLNIDRENCFCCGRRSFSWRDACSSISC